LSRGLDVVPDLLLHHPLVSVELHVTLEIGNLGSPVSCEEDLPKITLLPRRRRYRRRRDDCTRSGCQRDPDTDDQSPQVLHTAPSSSRYEDDEQLGAQNDCPATAALAVAEPTGVKAAPAAATVTALTIRCFTCEYSLLSMAPRK
jgi:hypothetical protein